MAEIKISFSQRLKKGAIPPQRGSCLEELVKPSFRSTELYLCPSPRCIYLLASMDLCLPVRISRRCNMSPEAVKSVK